MPDNKCSFPEGVTVKPDGVNELDPCLYEITDIFRNVTVEISRCKRCGTVNISWKAQGNTEHETAVSDDAESTM